jgi:hypothetical protein
MNSPLYNSGALHVLQILVYNSCWHTYTNHAFFSSLFTNHANLLSHALYISLNNTAKSHTYNTKDRPSKLNWAKLGLIPKMHPMKIKCFIATTIISKTDYLKTNISRTKRFLFLFQQFYQLQFIATFSNY